MIIDKIDFFKESQNTNGKIGGITNENFLRNPNTDLTVIKTFEEIVHGFYIIRYTLIAYAKTKRKLFLGVTKVYTSSVFTESENEYEYKGYENFIDCYNMSEILPARLKIQEVYHVNNTKKELMLDEIENLDIISLIVDFKNKQAEINYLKYSELENN